MGILRSNFSDVQKMMWWSYFTVLGFVYTYANGALPRIPESNSDSDNGVNLQFTAGRGEWSNALKEEIMKSNLEKVKELINSGLDVHAVNPEGESYLHIAACSATATDTSATDTENNGEITKFLLSKGIKVDAKDSKGVTPLITAAKCGNTKAAEVLIENNADMDYQDTGHKQGTAILYCSWAGFYNVTKLLVAKGANVNVQFKNNVNYRCQNKWTPLHCVAYFSDDLLKRSLEMVKLLVGAGAEVNPVDECGKTPMYLAKQGYGAEHQAIVRYLKSKGGFAACEKLCKHSKRLDSIQF